MSLDFDGDGSGDACDTDVDGDQVANGGNHGHEIGTLVDPQNGCSLAQLCPCAGPAGTTTPWKNHGKYVSCVAHVAGDFAAAGLVQSVTEGHRGFRCGPIFLRQVATHD